MVIIVIKEKMVKKKDEKMVVVIEIVRWNYKGIIVLKISNKLTFKIKN
jgi:hypothetical protein